MGCGRSSAKHWISFHATNAGTTSVTAAILLHRRAMRSRFLKQNSYRSFQDAEIGLQNQGGQGCRCTKNGVHEGLPLNPETTTQCHLYIDFEQTRKGTDALWCRPHSHSVN